MTKTGERIDDLFQLLTEQNAHKNETPDVEQRSQSIEEQKSSSADTRSAGQWRRDGAEARDEFRPHHTAHAILRHEVLRPTNARVRLQRDAAEKLEHALAATASQ